MRSDISIRVESLTIVESGEYPNQFLRPYVSELNGSLIDRIEERFAKTRRFTPSILAEIANQFMVPDYMHRGVIDIPNGWDERRGRFILMLDIKVGTGDTIKQVVMGYTNSVGFTTRHVDHDMEFYVNNTFLLTPRTIMTDRGYKETLVPIHTNDILSDRDNAGLSRRRDTLFTMRPEDVFSAIDVEQTGQLVESLTDLRTTLSRNAIKSSTSNRLGSRFMSKVLDARHKALDNAEYGTPLLDINATAQGYAQDSYGHDDLFLRTISNIRGQSTTSDTFTFRDLLYIDQHAEQFTRPYLLDDNARSASRYTEDTTPLDGQEEEDRIAALIATAVPALMAECAIHSVHFQVHNQTLSGGYDFVPLKANSFIEDMDLSSFLSMFESRLIDELLLPITGGNRYDIGIDLKCTSFGDVVFSLYWDGSNRGRYVIPVFCNSLTLPIVTNDKDDVSRLARNFSDLFEEFLPTETAGGGLIKSGSDFGY